MSDYLNKECLCYKKPISLCYSYLWQAVPSPKKQKEIICAAGNKLYNDSLFIKAEVDYRKALEINPKSTDAMFNLGNSLLMQQKQRKRWNSLNLLLR